MPVRMHSSMKRLDYPVYSFMQKVIIMEMDSTWVKWETLRHMTINQLAEAIGIQE